MLYHDASWEFNWFVTSKNQTSQFHSIPQCIDQQVHHSIIINFSQYTNTLYAQCMMGYIAILLGRYGILLNPDINRLVFLCLSRERERSVWLARRQEAISGDKYYLITMVTDSAPIRFAVSEPKKTHIWLVKNWGVTENAILKESYIEVLHVCQIKVLLLGEV